MSWFPALFLPVSKLTAHLATISQFPSTGAARPSWRPRLALRKKSCSLPETSDSSADVLAIEWPQTDHRHDILLLSLTNHPEIQTTFLILRRGPLLYECSVNWANKCIYRKIVQHTSPRVLAAFGGEAAWEKPPLNTGTSLCYIFLFSGCWIIAFGGDPLYGEWGADCFCHCRGRLWRFSPIFLQNAFFIYIP